MQWLPVEISFQDLRTFLERAAARGAMPENIRIWAEQSADRQFCRVNIRHRHTVLQVDGSPGADWIATGLAGLFDGTAADSGFDPAPEPRVSP